MAKKQSVPGKHASPGDGTLRRRKDGLWEYRVVVGVDEDQKPLRLSFYSSDTTGVGAKEKYRAWLADQAAPIEQVKTVKQWAEYWLETYKKDQVAYRSYQNYKMYVERHIIPAIGNVKLEDVRPAHIATIYRQRANLSASALRHIGIALNGIFETAIDNRLATVNPCKKAHAPKTPVKAPKAWTVADVNRILAFAAIHEYGIYPLGLLHTGLREGELCALCRSDLHLDDGYISITKAVAEIEPPADAEKTVRRGNAEKNRHFYNIKPCPKSGRDRNVVLSPSAVAFFRSIPNTGNYVFGFRPAKTKRKEDVARRMACLPVTAAPADDKVSQFGNEFMSIARFRYRYDTFFKDLNVHLADAAKEDGTDFVPVPCLSPHKCRHTYATNLLKGCGNLRAVQSQLGHADVSTTEIYTQVDMESMKDNVSKLSY